MPSRQNEKAIEGPDYLHCKEAILSCVISLISESRNVQLVVRTSRGMFPSYIAKPKAGGRFLFNIKTLADLSSSWAILRTVRRF